MLRIELVLDDEVNDNRDIVIHINGSKVNANINKVKTVERAGDENSSFLDFFERYMEKAEATKSARTLEAYRHVFKRLKDYLVGIGMSEMAPNEVNGDFAAQYERYMKDCGLVLNTISFHFRVIRTVYNKAVEAGHCHDQKPFKYAYTSIAKTVKRAIPFDVIKAIKQYRAENAPVAYAKDMFMFSFYTRGMSLVDMAYLKSSNIKDGILTYQRRKTGQTLRMKWEPCMQQIVDRYHKKGQPYLLPIIHSQNGKERNQYRHKQNLVNQNLKLIASSVNCEHHLTLYVARHSWATIAEQHGLPVNLISLGLGHNSEKTTQIYLKSLRQSQIDEANANIISMMGD